MIRSLDFHTKFQDSYLRNNRTTGQKSLRCFPFCRETNSSDYSNLNTVASQCHCSENRDYSAHVVRGYCGRSIRVTTTLSLVQLDGQGITSWNLEQLLFLLEIRPADEPRISRMNYVRKADVDRRIRVKTRRCAADATVVDHSTDKNIDLFAGRWTILGAANNTVTLQIVFNNDNCSWDYNWKSNRWSGEYLQS